MLCEGSRRSHISQPDDYRTGITLSLWCPRYSMGDTCANIIVEIHRSYTK